MQHKPTQTSSQSNQTEQHLPSITQQIKLTKLNQFTFKLGFITYMPKTYPSINPKCMYFN